MVIQGYACDPEIQAISKEILNLHNNIFKENQQDSFEKCCGKFGNKAYWFIFSNEGRIIGLATIGESAGAWHLFNVGVHWAFRRQNIAHCLEKRLKEKTKGAEIFGFVHKDNFNAKLVFHKLGASYVSQKGDYDRYSTKQLAKLN
jgi:ribosomal protein S18 acetylase RimI-like enzyme